MNPPSRPCNMVKRVLEIRAPKSISLKHRHVLTVESVPKLVRSIQEEGSDKCDKRRQPVMKQVLPRVMMIQSKLSTI